MSLSTLFGCVAVNHADPDDAVLGVEAEGFVEVIDVHVVTPDGDRAARASARRHRKYRNEGQNGGDQTEGDSFSL